MEDQARASDSIGARPGETRVGDDYLGDRGRDLAGRPFYSACYAPFTSLHIEPNGNVKACCMNQWHHLGNVATDSLHSIWHGDSLQELRDAVAVRDFSHGCGSCASEIRRGNPESAQLRVFDAYPAADPTPAWPSNLELALSNTCNLQCVMCNGELSSAIRRHRERRDPLPDPFDQRFFHELDDFLPHLSSVTFLGGEPFLARSPLRIMERLVESGLEPQCSVITNGTRLDERVRRLVSGLPMHVSVSIDAIEPHRLEQIRVGVDPVELFRNIEEFRRLTADAGNGMALSFSLMRSNYDQLGRVLALADRLDCDVFVVKVFHPGRYSLHHAPPEELSRALWHLEREDRIVGAQLQRNREAWEHQIDWLRGLLHRRPAEEPVTLTSGRSKPGRQWDGAIHTDGDLVIRAVEPSDLRVAGIEIEHFIGRTLLDVQQKLIERMGGAVSSEVWYRSGGVQENEVRFEPPGRRPLSIDTQMSVDDEGRHTWRVAVR